MNFRLHIILMVGILALAFGSSLTLKFNTPTGWPKPNYDFTKNPLTAEVVELGRHLFYDPVLSRDSSISCASCHSPYNAFTHSDHSLSHGINDRIGTRNSPALINLAWQKTFMWDGAIHHLDVQALAPISHPDEMGETMENVVKKLNRSPVYRAYFYKAFKDSLVSGEHSLKALSQFLLTLVSADSKYDSVMRHQSKFTAQEKNGYQLFKSHCATCHTEPLFTNLGFENNGLAVDTTLNDFGRIKISKNRGDSLKFKVPTLRNIEFSYPYMHDGRYKKLMDVIKHYSGGVQKSPTLALSLEEPILLSSNQRVDLLAFLLTLSDKSFLNNPKFTHPATR